MTTLALITMLTVQTTVTVITVWFLMKTLRKTNHHPSPETDRTPKHSPS